ncbi:MAG: hypothetical protein J6S44_03980, partial [Clostridia bacterium]|nr:hypothetical protein [Clostridia bacterium]
RYQLVESSAEVEGTAQRSSYLPVVHTFTDVAQRKRNVIRVNKQYMVENDSRNAPYKNTIEEAVNSFNARAIRRYASKSGLTPGEVKRKSRRRFRWLKGAKFSLPSGGAFLFLKMLIFP